MGPTPSCFKKFAIVLKWAFFVPETQVYRGIKEFEEATAELTDLRQVGLVGLVELRVNRIAEAR